MKSILIESKDNINKGLKRMKVWRRYKKTSGKEIEEEQKLIPILVDREDKSRPKLTVDDVYAALGHWNRYYVNVIVLNSLMFCLAKVNLNINEITTTKVEAFEITDCDGTIYDSFPNTHLIYMDLGNSIILGKDQRYALEKMGTIMGFLFCMFFHRLSRSSIVVIGSILCTFANVITIGDLKYCFSLYKTTSMFGITLISLGTTMNCLESLPDHLRPLGMFVMFFMESFVTLLLYVILRVVPSWKYISLILASLHLIFGALYFYGIPRGVVASLTNKNKAWLSEILIKFTPRGRNFQKRNPLSLKRRRKNPGERKYGINVEHLIDDVMYVGHVTFSMWDTIRETLRIKPYRNKLLILILNAPLMSITSLSLTHYLGEAQGHGIFEGKLYIQFKYVVTYTIACLCVYMFGRRISFLIYSVITVIGTVMMILLMFSAFNVCSINNYPGARWVSYSKIAIFISTIGPGIGRFLTRMVIVEHIPFSSRGIVVPLVFLISELLAVMLKIAIQQQALSFYPNSVFILIFFYSILVFPLNSFLDNTSHMAITIGDIPCYYTTAMKYPKKVEYHDLNPDETPLPAPTTPKNQPKPSPMDMSASS